jgi:uncharacterized protein (DUF2062 family)
MTRHVKLGVQSIRELWDRARREHSTPPEVAWSVAVGVLSGSTPLWGLHMWIALGLATVLRLNRLWAFLGSRVSFGPIYVWIVLSEIELGHRARTGAWASMTAHDAWSYVAAGGFLHQGKELLVDWIAGSFAVGPALAAAAGLVAYGAARRAPVTPRTPGALLPPSSGSPRSEPPAPTR